MVKVLVNGYQGRMGREAVKAIEAADGLALVGQTGLGDDLVEQIQHSGAEVVVDLTVATAVFENVSHIIEAGAHAVVGTSGLLPEQLKVLEQRCLEKKVGCIVAPNFSLGAVLMMKAAKEMAKRFEYAEIIEMHHHQKQDAPSGTAVKTAEMIAEHLGSEVGQSDIPAAAESKELLPGSRGAVHQGVPIHAVRLPGMVAHQTVLFGGYHESLQIRHDSLDRRCFMPGVLLACREVMGVEGLVYGLENLL